MNEIVSIRGAARRLGKSHSTISRYLQGCPELNHGTTERPLVNVEELRRHRAANINPSRIGSHAGRLLGEGETPPPPVAAADAPPAATKVADSPNYQLAKAVRETVLAQRARVDLDEKRGFLVPRAEVEDAIFDAGAVFQRDLLAVAGRVSEPIAAMSDPREIAALLETEHRRVLATLAASLRAEAAAEHRATAEAPPAHNGDRIDGT